jgi:hypothetical protein
MSGSLSGQRKRLAKVERELASILRPEPPSECNCGSSTVASPDKAEEFEAEMNRTCPTHGVRRLGWLAIIEHIGRRGDHGAGRLAQLVETYQARQPSSNKLLTIQRLSRLREVSLEPKRSSQEP